MKHPLVGPLAALASGVLLARYVPLGLGETSAAVAAMLLMGALALYRKSLRLAGACCLLGFVFAGALTAIAHAPGPPPRIDATSREVVILGGCVVEPPAVSGERERFVMELDRNARAQVTLYTRPDETLPALYYGQNIEVDAKVRKPRNFGNPGAFDYARYLARQDIYWTASANASSVRVLPGKCGSAFQKVMMDLRQAALARIDALYPGRPYSSGMMQAILIGQSFQLQKVWTEAYRSTGTFHALVISGTHVAILAGVFLFLLRICLVPQSIAMLLTVLAAWLYTLVAGWQAPCIRSAAGLTLYMIGGYFYRERRVMNLLAAVALGFLILDPDQLFDASFQLTFLAVGFLAVFAVPAIKATSGPLTAGLRDLRDKARDLTLEPRVAQFRIELRLLSESFRVPLPAIAFAAHVVFFFYEIVLTSAVIQLGLALPMVVYFHRLGISGLTANAFVVPLMGLVVPVGFLALFTGSVWVAKTGGALLWLSHQAVTFHANLEPNWRIPTPPLWLVIGLSLALIGAAIAITHAQRKAAGAAVALLLALVVWHPFAAVTHPGELELTAIDVGQGDSLLVVFPDGKRMLMDGGGIPVFGHAQRSNLDTGEDVVAPYLWDRGIRRVDIIALSHAHEDHSGGLPALIADFRPAELWTGATPASPVWDRVREAAERAGTKIRGMHEPSRFKVGGADIEVLAPMADYQPKNIPKNDDSLVLRLTYGGHTFLLSGDVERPVEREMLGLGEVHATEVLKVAHHGSRTSSTEEFLDAVHPAFAIISAGFENSYGHPTATVLDRLEARHATVLRTDIDGLITIRTDGHRLRVQTYSGFLSQR